MDFRKAGDGILAPSPLLVTSYWAPRLSGESNQWIKNPWILSCMNLLHKECTKLLEEIGESARFIPNKFPGCLRFTSYIHLRNIS